MNRVQMVRWLMRHTAHRLNIAAEELAALIRLLAVDSRIPTDLIEADERAGVVGNYAPPRILVNQTHDCTLYAEDGRQYLDYQGAYSANNAGNCNARITGANHLAAAMTSVLSRARWNRQLPILARELHLGVSAGFKVLPMNSGCEAIEGAALLAKLTFHRHPDFQAKRDFLAARGVIPKVVVCNHNFHGRSSWAKAVSSNPAYRDPFAPNSIEQELLFVDFGDLEATALLLARQDVYAFIAEPIQCEGGMNLPPDGYLKAVRALCYEHDVLMVLDEVQTGLGRTGKMLAQEHYLGHDRADFVALGKSISGGQEVASAVLARAEYADLLQAGEHGSTFGGSPKAALTMRAAIRELQDRNLCFQAEVLGHNILNSLRMICMSIPEVVEVRGLGLAIGVEVIGDGASRICERLRDSPFVFRGQEYAGCWTNATHGLTDATTVIRISPPLTVPHGLMFASLYSFAQAVNHPEPETFRLQHLEEPSSTHERLVGLNRELAYYSRRAERFLEELINEIRRAG
jgi:ornithine--oxo-acid transaminase